MGVNKYNSEKYHDPTAFEALSNIKKEASMFLPLVYICSPYSGNVEKNVEAARQYCRFAVDQKAIPIAPHLLYPQFMDDEKERELVRLINKVILGKCEEVWVFGQELSPGMAYEVEKAKKYKKTIRYFSEEMRHV